MNKGFSVKPCQFCRYEIKKKKNCFIEIEKNVMNEKKIQINCEKRQ